MKTEVMPASPQAISEAARLICAGETVAFPTETVYGLGANALCDDAVRKIFAAKSRPANNPLIAHVATPQDALGLWTFVPDEAQELMRRWWPGPLTIVLPRSAIVPNVVTAEMPTVGVRCPNNATALAIIAECGLPVAAPSANASGRPSPTTAGHVLRDLNGRVPLIIDGGPCEIGLESTVIDMSKKPFMLLRPGGVTLEQLRQTLGDCVVTSSGVFAAVAEGEKVASPGLLHKHYAPNAEVTLVVGDCAATALKTLYDDAAERGKKPAVLAFSDTVAELSGRISYSLGDRYMPRQAAQRLFAILISAEEDGRDTLFLEDAPQAGIGLALRNRMQRAAGFRVVKSDEL